MLKYKQIYVCKFDHQISKIVNKITKIPRTLKKVVLLFQIFGGPSAKFFIDWFLLGKLV